MCISCMLSCRDYMLVALYHSLGSGTLPGRMLEGVFIKPRLIGFCLRCHDKPVETMKDLCQLVIVFYDMCSIGLLHFD